MEVKLNVWQILGTAIGIVLAFIVVEEIKKHRYNKHSTAFGGGLVVGGGLDVAGEPVINGGVDLGAGAGTGSRTIRYN